jgi:HAD superfamily hydrolase (TIGR01509 family)
LIKLAIFDLDGVLLDSREMHYQTLNRALEAYVPEHVIEREDHLHNFDGRPTTKKLEILSARGLDADLHMKIFEEKQKLTGLWLASNIAPNPAILDVFNAVRDAGLRIMIASNAVRTTVDTFIQASGLTNLVDASFSNNDVVLHKPNPQVYLYAMAKAGVSPNETLIIEDTPVGCSSAHASGAHVYHVTDVNWLHDGIMNIARAIRLADSEGTGTIVPNLDVIVPMAGAGSRFQHAGYGLPKPLIDVCGKPMIKVVTDSIGLNALHTFLVREEHMKRYDVDVVLKLIKPGCKIISVPVLTDGAACTVLIARSTICFSRQLLIVNSDQDVKWNWVAFACHMKRMNADAGIVTFKATDPKWSFARVNDEGYVTEVAEKKQISDNATVGIYWWRRGTDFVRYAEQMMSKNIRVNGEFYVCPVFNEAIADGKKVVTFDAEQMEGLGTPEDLLAYVGGDRGASATR